MFVLTLNGRMKEKTLRFLRKAVTQLWLNFDTQGTDQRPRLARTDVYRYIQRETTQETGATDGRWHCALQSRRLGGLTHRRGFQGSGPHPHLPVGPP